MRRSASARMLAIALLYAALWLVGVNLYFPGDWIWRTPLEHQVHLAVVLAISVMVIGRAATARGSFEDRLKQVVISISVMFGTYALIILIGRYFFSRSILTSVIPATLVVSLLIVWWRNRRGGVKVAIIAPLVKSVPPRITVADVLLDPETDFRAYDLVLVDLHEPVSAEWAGALSRAMLRGCRIRHIEDYAEELSGAVAIEHFELEHLPATDQDSYISIKRLMDIVGVIVLTPIALPVVLLAGIGVALTSGWPVFFIQARAGLGGAPFQMWKLRTMRPESGNSMMRAAVPGDQRVTPFGRIIRRARIDELPQLWNVLKGDMSLIGPRPEMMAFHDAYTAVEPKFAFRCLVRPGITGWAQVNAPPSANADEAVFKARYDLYYVKKQSLALDLQIAIRTLWTVLHGGGVR